MNKVPQKKILLSTLLQGLAVVAPADDCTILGLTLDSRHVHAGYLFCALRGANDDGCKYIDAAIANGALAILCDREITKKYTVPIFYIPKLSAKVGALAAKFYGYPAQNMTAIGVTGTNGKTSITQFIAAALTSQGQPCGVIGTVGVGLLEKLTTTGLTTPDAITVQKTLAELCAQGANAVAIEASSHSLEQNRLLGVDFKIAVFTNLTRDHLDYHKDMHSYAAAKRRLFWWPGLEYAVINADDDYGRELLQDLPATVKPFAYCVSEVACDLGIPVVRAHAVKIMPTGISAKVTTPWGDGILHSNLLGRFNLSNLLAVLATLCLLDINFNTALACIAKLTNVIGRMQMLGGGANQPLVVIDYAHTPDALEKTLLALREHCSGEIWCVFGCGGGRDRGKRPLMGQIAEHYSDQIIITNDNPRGDDPKEITDEILPGLLCPWAAEVEHDREVAIYHAIECAKAGDVVLLAGKGHEDYQIIGANKLPFSDIEKAQAALELLNK